MRALAGHRDVASRCVLPATRHDAPISHVCRNEQLIGKMRRDLLEPPRILERPRADDHAPGATLEQPLDPLLRANASADLNFHLCRRQYVLDYAIIRTMARDRVEIHDVQPAKACLLPLARDGGRVCEPDTFLSRIAADLQRACAPEQGQRWHDDHARFPPGLARPRIVAYKTSMSLTGTSRHEASLQRPTSIVHVVL